MANITHLLPAELLSRIFSLLPEQSDISACRLVCRSFRELSSPFLITKVIFALRLDTLARMREIIEHPYFSKHVTHLVYDASRYSGHTAIRWNDYVAKCEQSPRNIVDPSWTEWRNQESSIISSLCALDIGDRDSPRVRSNESLMDDSDDDSDDEETFPGMGEYYEVVYKMGCQHTFPDYYSRYKAQTTLLEQGIRERMLLAAFLKCPKLRNVIYTDYRGLIKHGETWNACCDRLFGLTLEPAHLGDLRRSCVDEVLEIFKAAENVSGARIEAFEVEPHPFSSIETAWTSAIISDLAPTVLPVLSHDHSSVRQLAKYFGRLHTVAFSYVDRTTRPGIPILSQLLESGSQDLRRLSIFRLPDTTRGPLDTDDPKMPGKDNDFLGLTFPRLQFVDLRHLHLEDTVLLRDFLGRHATSLREVRLVDCCVSDRAGEQEKLAAWAGQSISLTGVEIVTSSDLQILALGESYRADAVTKTNKRVVMPDMVEKTLRDIKTLESVWLGGRANSLRRSVDVADRAHRHNHLKWTLRPARLY